jgi:hypothetical protein
MPAPTRTTAKPATKPTATRPPTRGVPPPPSSQSSTAKVAFGDPGPVKGRGQKIILYGTGGIGKSTLSCLAPGPVALVDADESMDILHAQLIAAGIPIPKIVRGVTDWRSLRAAFQASGWDGVGTIVGDTVTKFEEWAVAHTLATKKHPDKGTSVDSIEGYGYGKGFQFVYDVFKGLLGDLDRHVRAGRNVILIAHECTTTVPNPTGEDWLRWEPRLQDPTSGKASIRRTLKEWCDHMIFVGYDIAVDKKGKAEGGGSRTMYPVERPHCMAKSRTCGEDIVLTAIGEDPWPLIIK